MHAVEYEHVLAGKNAYFHSKKYDESTIFNAPRNGTIGGVILIHKDGSVSCKGCCCNDNLGYKNLTNWGCKGESYAAPRFYTMLMRIDNPKTYYGDVFYPQSTTQVILYIPIDIHTHTHTPLSFDQQGISIRNVSNPTYDYSKCKRGCHIDNQGTYIMTEYDAFSPNITFIDPVLNVTTDDAFALEYSEACCSEWIPVNNHPSGVKYDNCGDATADVYFLYVMPSVAPTMEPTSIPTASSTHGVAVSVIYTLSINITDYVSLLANTTKDVLIGNVSREIKENIIGYSQQIVNVSTYLLQVDAAIMTSNERTEQQLIAYYEDNLEVTIVSRINSQTELHVKADNVQLEFDVIDTSEAANPAESMSTSEYMSSTQTIVSDESIGSMSDFKNILIVVSGLSALLTILIVIVLIKEKRKAFKKQINVSNNNEDFQMKPLRNDYTPPQKFANDEMLNGDVDEDTQTGQELDHFDSELLFKPGLQDEVTDNGMTTGKDNGGEHDVYKKMSSLQSNAALDLDTKGFIGGKVGSYHKDNSTAHI